MAASTDLPDDPATADGGRADRAGAPDLSDLPSLGYAEALAELEGILADLEDDGIDIDLLGAKVARATALIRLCRERITTARVQVERVVADLDTLSAVDDADGDDD